MQQKVLKYFGKKYQRGILPFFRGSVGLNPSGLRDRKAVSAVFLAPKCKYYLIFKPWLMLQGILYHCHSKFRLGQSVTAFSTEFRKIPDGYIFCQVDLYQRNER